MPYIYDFMTDKEFNKLTDEIFEIRAEYQNIGFEKYRNE